MSAIIDGKAFRAELNALGREIVDKETRNAMREAVKEAERVAKATSAFKDVTGMLRKNIRGTLISKTEGQLVANTPYAEFIENGSRAHEIHARNAPMLSFFWEKKGQWVEFEWVNHPGTKATKFMEAAGDWGGNVLYDALEAYTSDAIRRFNA